ncbi:protein YgfX [Vogesella sp. GCM10023246]|uniref:Protein YgfX n=1 Tax=Vogesella oryzagri TaxID=3160864 RepID=A0ABV1M3Z7_9NEIS
MHPQRMTPFGATLQYGRLLPAVLLCASVLLLLAVLALPWWQLLLVLVGWLLALVYLLRQSGRLAAPLQAFRVDARGQMTVQQRTGDWLPVHLLPASTALIWLVALQLADEAGRRYQLLVWRGAVDAEVHRALRVYVQWSRDRAAPLPDPS